MTKTLKDFMEVYRPKSPDEQKFVDKHVTVKHKDRNGNGDDVFNATNVKTDKRKESRHGYDSGEDEKVYEELVAAYAEKYDMTIEEVESIIEELIAEEVEDFDESYQELMALKNNIERNEKKMKSIPGIHPEKKRLAIQIDRDNKRHKELFNKYWGKNEEVEELGDVIAIAEEMIDELSKGALGSYIKKAKNDIDDRAETQGLRGAKGRQYDEYSIKNKMKLAKRHKGIETAVDKLTKEEAEDLDESFYKSHGHTEITRNKTHTTISHIGNMGNTVKAHVKPNVDKMLGQGAFDRLKTHGKESGSPDYAYSLKIPNKHFDSVTGMKEEVEELGEVLDTRASKMSYAQKNMVSHKRALDDYVHYDGEGQNPDKKADAHKTAMKRVRGLNTFVKNKVTKEEVEHIDEILDTPDAQKSYRRKAGESISYARNFTGLEKKAAKQTREKRFKGLGMLHKKLNKEEVDLEEEKTYTATSEKSKFDKGHRAKLIHPEGHVTYLSQKSYKTPEHAMDAAEHYHSLLRHPVRKIDNAMLHYNRRYDAKHSVKEEVEHIDEDWMHPDHAKALKDPNTSAARKKEIKDAYARAAARNAQQSDDHEAWKEKRAAAKQGRNYHEEVEIDEKTLTPAEMKKREEVVKAIKRGNPKMDKSMAYAIATKTAKRVAEEVEELDELSKKTLGSYVNKAASKIGDQGITAGLKIQNNEKADKNFKTMGKRQKGIAMATNKLTKEEAEELGEDTFTDASMANLHVMKHKQRMKDIEKSTKLHPLMKVRMMSDAKKKLAGLEKTRDHYVAKHEKAESRKKKVTEEVQIDELSKKTLGSYVSKAARSATGLMAGAAAIGATGGSAHGREMGRTAVKRLRGIDTAAKKLTKEDIINRTIDKYVPESSKYTPEERMLMRLEGVSENHVETLMGIFENLNSDNQNKMLIVAETHEGINSLIDFAITNRGE